MRSSRMPRLEAQSPGEVRMGSGITVEPFLERFGAEVSGVDISKPLDEAARAEIIAIQNIWGVTVWRNTGLNDKSHVAFSRIFGHVEIAPGDPARPRFSEPELFDATNLDVDGKVIDNELTRLKNKGNRLWHSDSSFMSVRSAQSLLLCHEAPPTGGETWFADSRSAYEDLPQKMKDRIEHLEAEHSYFWSRRKAGYPYTEEEIDEWADEIEDRFGPAPKAAKTLILASRIKLYASRNFFTKVTIRAGRMWCVCPKAETELGDHFFESGVFQNTLDKLENIKHEKFQLVHKKDILRLVIQEIPDYESAYEFLKTLAPQKEPAES